MLAGDPQEASTRFFEVLQRLLSRQGDGFHIPVVHNDQLEIVEVLGDAAGSARHLELIRFERAHQVLFALRRIVRHQQHARTTQRYGVLEARFAQIAGGNPARERDGAHRVNGGLQTQMVGAGHERHAARTDDLPFGGHLHLRGGSARRFESDFDGEMLAAEYLPGIAHRFEQQPRFGVSGKRYCIDGNPKLLRLPDGARHAAEILVAVGSEHDSRHHAGGHRGNAIANGRFQVRPVAWSGGGVA